MLRVCRELGVPVERFSEDGGIPGLPDDREWALLRRYRGLDDCGRELVELVSEAEERRVSGSVESVDGGVKVIPLYSTPAAAGYASPALGDDYTDYIVPASSAADFAVTIDGDSMEPYITDGSVALCRRGEIMHDGDVGLFFVDGDLKCKQYCRDYAGNVHLFSANRGRRDADVDIPASSGVTLFCFGKVLLGRKIPLPEV
jgi:phage repressor protein C with HTH and peptisase S24 domain